MPKARVFAAGPSHEGILLVFFIKFSLQIYKLFTLKSKLPCR
jgi:hypothetical protein